ncbi:MAG: adenylate/guanylate cyclase domain-containing protein [Spirochaetia bacterium]|nr:adenylate/guanylate cyclase domain-containing protein [Spirochaetia bacterium]
MKDQLSLTRKPEFDLDFEFIAYDLYSGIKENLISKIRKITNDLGRPSLAVPINTIVYELASNGMKALYKKAFFSYLIQDIGWDDISYENWLGIFKAEIESNKAINFSRVCREHNLTLKIRCKKNLETVRFEIVNDGIISEIEKKRLIEVVSKSKKLDSIYSLVGEEETEESSQAGLGIPLIVMTLRGLGLSLSNFHIIIKKNTTIARLDIPMRLFHGIKGKSIQVMNAKEQAVSSLQKIYERLGYSIVYFDAEGNVQSVTGQMLKHLRVPESDIDIFPTIIKAKFFEDIFTGPFSIKIVNYFENYRISIPLYDKSDEMMFNVSGVLENNNIVHTLWQIVNFEGKKGALSEGSVFENVHIQKLIAPYIPEMILDKARQSIRMGKSTLPNEVKDVTIFFGDLIGFTSVSEQMAHDKVIDLLNIAMNTVVHSVEKNSGNIDKFMGDGIMVIFLEPLSAVVAAIEIQNNFYQLNEFRKASNQESIDIRIGINSGNVILGSVGTKRRMDWTALGDVVNTASRIEKSSRKNSVLIGEETYERIKDHVTVSEKISKKVKGKEEEIVLYYVNSVSFVTKDRNLTLSLVEDEKDGLENN